MANGILDFFSREAGQQRRKALDEAIGYYVPPNLRGLLGFAAEMTPTRGIERAGQASQKLFDPGTPGWDRASALGDMASEIAGVVAPAAVAGKAGMPAAQALQEGLMGFSTSPQGVALRNFTDDESGALRLWRAGTETPEGRAQGILDLLTSGRASEVTDEMLDLGDPVANARLNQYLFRNYDLPMDEASRTARAEDRGGVGAYRGDRDLTQFMTGQGKQTGVGVTVSDSPAVANSYVGREEVLYPLVRFGGKGVSIDASGARWNDISPFADVTLSTGRKMGLDEILDPLEMLDDVQLNELEHFMATGERLPDSDFGYSTDDLARLMQRRNADYTSFTNIVDPGAYGRFKTPEANLPATTTMIADPSNVRSRFARFDPRLAHLKNLSAGIVAAPLGLLALRPQEEQY